MSIDFKTQVPGEIIDLLLIPNQVLYYSVPSFTLFFTFFATEKSYSIMKQHLHKKHRNLFIIIPRTQSAWRNSGKELYACLAQWQAESRNHRNRWSFLSGDA